MSQLISYGASGAETIVTDAGSAVAVNNTIDILGGSNINTTGAGATVTVNLDSALQSITSVGNTGNITLHSDSSVIVTSVNNSTIINSGLTVNKTGENVNTLQPAFLYHATGNTNNVTGNGTDYTIAYNTKILDNRNNFDGTTFTAPTTGLYMFELSVQLANCKSDVNFDTGYVSFVSTSRTYLPFIINPYFAATNGGALTINSSVIAYLTSGQTMRSVITVLNAAKVIGVVGSVAGEVRTSFAGYLIC